MPEQLKAKLRESEERYRSFTDNLSDTIWVVDAESLQYLYISSSVRELRGMKPDDMIGRSLQETLHPDSFKLIKPALKKAMQEYKQGLDPTRRFQMEVYRRDGSTMWVEAGVKFHKEPGEPLCIIGLSRDIDEQKRWEFKTARLVEELKEAVAEKDRLLKENKILIGLLPICSYCKKIRDEDGAWQSVEKYIASRTEADFTHTICPDCLKIYHSDLDLDF